MVVPNYPNEESLLIPKYNNNNKVKDKFITISEEDIIKDDKEVVATDSSNEPEGKVEQKKKIPALGIILTLLSVLCYSLSAAIVNLLPELHSIEILVIRSLFQFFPFTIITLLRSYPIAPAKGQRWDMAMRLVSGTITLITIFVAYRMMPLADASTIRFSSQVFVAIFAYFMLNETLSILEGIAGIITLVGVVVIAQPEFIFGAQSNIVYDNRLLGTILALVASISGALSMINLRKLKSTPVPVTLMWFSGFVIIVGIIILLALDALVMPYGWYTWALLIGNGFCGIGDQFFVSKALQYDSPGPVTVTRTFNVVMTFVWEAVLLGETIEWLSVIGASLITSCVLMLAIDKWIKQIKKSNNNNLDDIKVQSK